MFLQSDVARYAGRTHQVSPAIGFALRRKLTGGERTMPRVQIALTCLALLVSGCGDGEPGATPGPSSSGERVTQLEKPDSKLHETPKPDPVYGGMPLSHWVDLLRQPNANVRQEGALALEAMGRTQTDETIAALARSLEAETDPTAKTELIRVLGRMGPLAVAASSQILAIINNASPRVEQVGMGSGMYGMQSDSQSDPDGNDLTLAAIDALSKICPNDRAFLEAVTAVLNKGSSRHRLRALQLVAVLQAPKQELIPSLIQEIDREEHVREAAAQLSKFGPDAAEALPALRKAWVRLKHDPSPETTNLGYGLGTPSAPNPVDDFATKWAIARALAEIDINAAIPVLLEFTQQQIPRIQKAAPDSGAYGRMGPAAGYGTGVLDASATPPEYDSASLAAVVEATKYLGKAGQNKSESIEALLASSDHPEADIAEAARSALQQFDETVRVETCCAVLARKDESSQRHIQAALLLAELGPSATIAIPILESALQENRPVAAVAAIALAKIDTDAKRHAAKLAAALQHWASRAREEASQESSTNAENAKPPVRIRPGGSSGMGRPPSGMPGGESYGPGNPAPSGLPSPSDGPAVSTQPVAKEIARKIGLVLVQIDSPKALVAIRELLQQGDRISLTLAAELAAEIGPAGGDLATAFRNHLLQDREVAASCARALGEIAADDKETVSALQQSLTHWAQARNAAAVAPGMAYAGDDHEYAPFGGRQRNSVAEPVEVAGHEIGRALIKLDLQAGVATLVGLVESKDATSQMLASDLLAEIGPPARNAVPALSKLYQTLRTPTTGMGTTGPYTGADHTTRATVEETVRIALAKIRGIEIPKKSSESTINKAAAVSRLAKPAQAVALSYDGALLAAQFKSEVCLINAATGEVQASLEDSGGVLNGLKERRSTVGMSFSPDGKVLSFGAARHVVLWKMTSGTVWRKIWGHSKEVDSVAFSPDGKLGASTSADGVRVWSAGGSDELVTNHSAGGKAACVAFSPDGQRIAVGLNGGQVLLLDAKAGEAQQTFQTDSDPVPANTIRQPLDVVWSLDGRNVAAVVAAVPVPAVAKKQGQKPSRRKTSRNAASRRKSRAKGRPAQTPAPGGYGYGNDDAELFGEMYEEPGYTGEALGLDSGGAASTAYVWDAETGELLNRLDIPSPTSCVLSPCGRILAEGSSAGIVFLHVTTGLELGQAASAPPKAGNSAEMEMPDPGLDQFQQRFVGQATMLAFSGNGRRLIAVAADRTTVTVWDVSDLLPRP